MRTVIYFLVSMGVSNVAAAQSLQAADSRVEVFGGIGWGHLFRVEDQTFGDRPNIAAGLGVELFPRVRVELEFSDTVGLTPDSTPCGAPPGITCVGEGRDGFSRARMATGNVAYFFSNGRTQPYITGGIGTLWSKGVSSITFGGGNPWIITEQEFHERGLVWHVGTGVRLAVTRRIFIRPEFRIYDSTIQSRVNLNMLRGSVAVGYGW
ncbi:MAG TPA: outer membrane beta-barrel protein [Vicinamibacterales bacterium]